MVQLTCFGRTHFISKRAGKITLQPYGPHGPKKKGKFKRDDKEHNIVSDIQRYGQNIYFKNA